MRGHYFDLLLGGGPVGHLQEALLAASLYQHCLQPFILEERLTRLVQGKAMLLEGLAL